MSVCRLACLRARYETRDAGGEDFAQIAVNIEFEALEEADVFDDFCFDYEYLFFLCHIDCACFGIFSF